MQIKFKVKKFNDLTPIELYQILKLRSDIFIVEQNCAYPDIDGKDLHSLHLMCLVDDVLAGYTRLLPAGISYEEISIGRVVIAAEYRGLKLGKALMEQSIAGCAEFFSSTPIRIGAQTYLRKFYAGLGFVETGDPYMEDGIEHVEMVLVP